ncbi:MAG: hypothetical protein LPK03_11770, partial [Pontibacter sp.]|nr:hypothetical protein [Pontibacter sp.]
MRSSCECLVLPGQTTPTPLLFETFHKYVIYKDVLRKEVVVKVKDLLLFIPDKDLSELAAQTRV